MKYDGHGEEKRHSRRAARLKLWELEGVEGVWVGLNEAGIVVTFAANLLWQSFRLNWLWKPKNNEIIFKLFSE